ncbi:MAG: OmpH family outer membrane protein [Candidatus Omnitrophica bacterium]|nr:OmpH family outer membrane protein [Candidatus Omnitrophota bacterium]MCG2702836.1 OmpH family outer membrane protein [Candidatus Omnitrophota bacterium]
MKKQIIITVAILLFAQQWCFAEELKIGYIGLGRVFEAYKKVADSNKELDKSKNEVKAMVTDMQKLQDGFDTLSNEAKEERKKEMLARQEDVRKRTVDVRKEEDRILREILKDIENASSELRKKKKMTYIIDDRLIIDGPKDLDVTNEIVTLLNDRYGKGK